MVAGPLCLCDVKCPPPTPLPGLLQPWLCFADLSSVRRANSSWPLLLRQGQFRNEGGQRDNGKAPIGSQLRARDEMN